MNPFPKFFLLCCCMVLFSCEQAIEEVPFTPDDQGPSERDILAKYLDLPDAAFRYNDKGDPYDYRVYLERPHSQTGVVSVADPAAITLGRVLFYDTKLSSNGKVSCASCHQQKHAFGDSVASSLGVSHLGTARNSYPLGSFLSFQNYYVNTTFNGDTPGFFWDSRTRIPNDQIREALSNPHEMGMTPELLPEILDQYEYYPILYKRAFKQEPFAYPMKTDQLIGSIWVFMTSITTQNSRFDEELQAIEPFGVELRAHEIEAEFVGFSEEENKGKKLFFRDCGSCHATFLGYEVSRAFNELEGFSACNGLESSYQDNGRGAAMNDPLLNGEFKVPSLRNIAVSAPYMHDGRFSTLEEVIDFYSTGIQQHENLHELLREPKGAAIQFNYSAQEKADLIAFLHTLTDEKMLTDEKWSDPFIR